VSFVSVGLGYRLPIVELTTVGVIVKMITPGGDPDKPFCTSRRLFAIGAHSQWEAVSTFIHGARLEVGTDIASKIFVFS
jgi:hypothetical protein